MIGAPPLSLKHLNPYLQRADEIQRKDPITAYWCRYYAAQLGIKARESNKGDNGLLMFLLGLMDHLEQEKKSLESLDAINNDLVASAHVEDFAMKLFNFADNEDRAGRCTKKTVRAFFAASNLLEVLKTFNEELDEDIAEKLKYAKYKAIYITKCLRDGVEPVPGPPYSEENAEGDDEDGMERNDTYETDGASTAPPASSMDDQYPATTTTTTTTTTTDPIPYTQPPAYNPPPSITLPSPPPSTPPQTQPQHQKQPFSYSQPPLPTTAPTSIPPTDISVFPKIQKLCKQAGSALDYDDVPTAIAQLKQALSMLTGEQY